MVVSVSASVCARHLTMVTSPECKTSVFAYFHYGAPTSCLVHVYQLNETVSSARVNVKSTTYDICYTVTDFEALFMFEPSLDHFFYGIETNNRIFCHIGIT